MGVDNDDIYLGQARFKWLMERTLDIFRRTPKSDLE